MNPGGPLSDAFTPAGHYLEPGHGRRSPVSIGHQVSPLVGAIAGSLPAGARVLAPEGDFTSVRGAAIAQTQPDVSRREVDRSSGSDASEPAVSRR
jgi:hypothetical protein